ncbi:HAD family hydrolase [Type-D symbiont of Plautia stali]|uniref:HAD family hydrolase n=1 Tax=Type-D symbiont of Plautia stali TaxID=1560356 RepID=UPI00073EC153|nr:HAD-IA family hydrolase [Type-D symbiont of Plautia stali]
MKNLMGSYLKKIEEFLRSKLPTHYDVILLWETPVPFLDNLYSESLIIHQMPGAFCRAPYPHMVTFDPIGLYKHGPLYKHFEEIIGKETNENNFVTDFGFKVKDSISKLSTFTSNELDPTSKFKKLTLLPLQTSGHYAFQADTPYISQADYLVETLQNTDQETGLVVTQYVTPKVKDTVLNSEVVSAIKGNWGNIIYDEKFDQINSISQYLIPHVSEVVSCSSSIALQSMIWNRDIKVPHDTFMRKLSLDEINRSKWSKEEVYSSVLDFILNNQQILASKILSDGHFLDSLIKKLIKNKMEGKSGIELYADFTSIDPNYSNSVLESFTVERAARDIKNADESISLMTADAFKLERIVRREGVEHITFDVFDTLINRPVESPSDAYKFLETIALNLSNGLTEDFFKVRLTSEVETRRNSDKGEITLDEIYEKIQDHYQINIETLEKIKKAEIELEISLIESRPAGKKLWEAAVRCGKPISIISDMYLPHCVVEKMLDKAGYSGYKKLYVSSSYGVRKKEGGLFDIVLDELNIPSEKVLHVGDNVAADISMPKSKGMLTFRILRALDRMRNHTAYKKIFNPRRGAGEKPRSIIAGLIATKLFDSQLTSAEDNSLFMGRPFNLGYSALGPMLTSYMQWVSRQAKEDGISRLFFLSREGWLLKQIYDVIVKDDDKAAPSTYLYCSRRAVRVASIKNKNDILNLASQPFSSGITLSKLLDYRFGLDSKEITNELAISFGFTSQNEELESDAVTKVRFSKLCLALEEKILEQSEKEREVYLEYAKNSGLLDESKPGIIDIGWKANMQASLGNLINRPLNGYYYATLQGAECWLKHGHEIKGFIGDFVTLEHSSSAVNNRHLTEFLICHSERSLISMSKDSSGLIVKNFRDEPNHAMRSSLIDEIHSGAISYSRDVYKRFGHLSAQAYCDWSLGEKVFSEFLNNPHQRDASMFVGYAFEDSFGGVSKKFVIANKSDQVSVFAKGADVYYAKSKPQPLVKQASQVQNTVAKPKPSVNLEPDEITVVPRFYRIVESFVLKRFSSEKKYKKYTKDRDNFFLDSKAKSMQKWYKISTRRIS